jgi:hypothetical protein
MCICSFSARRPFWVNLRRNCMPSETSALPTTAVIIQLRVIRLQRAAISTGQRNTCIESLSWGFKLQCLSGSFI